MTLEDNEKPDHKITKPEVFGKCSVMRYQDHALEVQYYIQNLGYRVEWTQNTVIPVPDDPSSIKKPMVPIQPEYEEEYEAEPIDVEESETSTEVLSDTHEEETVAAEVTSTSKTPRRAAKEKTVATPPKTLKKKKKFKKIVEGAVQRNRDLRANYLSQVECYKAEMQIYESEVKALTTKREAYNKSCQRHDKAVGYVEACYPTQTGMMARDSKTYKSTMLVCDYVKAIANQYIDSETKSLHALDWFRKGFELTTIKDKKTPEKYTKWIADWRNLIRNSTVLESNYGDKVPTLVRDFVILSFLFFLPDPTSEFGQRFTIMIDNIRSKGEKIYETAEDLLEEIERKLRSQRVESEYSESTTPRTSNVDDKRRKPKTERNPKDRSPSVKKDLLCEYCPGIVGHLEDNCRKIRDAKHRGLSQKDILDAKIAAYKKFGKTIQPKHEYFFKEIASKSREAARNTIKPEETSLEEQKMVRMVESMITKQFSSFKDELMVCSITPRNNLDNSLIKSFLSEAKVVLVENKDSTIHLLNSRSNRSNSSKWLLDSGATHMMSASKDIFDPETYQTLKNEKVYLADDTGVEIEGVGNISMEVAPGITKTFQKALHVPTLQETLISVCSLVKDTEDLVIFGYNKVLLYIKNTNKLIALGRRIGNLYYIDIHNDVSKDLFNYVHHIRTKNEKYKSFSTRKYIRHLPGRDYEFWHKTLGCSGHDRIANTLELAQIPFDFSKADTNCTTCLLNKFTRIPIPPQPYHAPYFLHTICEDLKDIGYETFYRARYASVIKDKKTKSIFINWCTKKSQADEKMMEFITSMEAKYDLKVSTLISDGGEMISNEMNLFCNNHKPNKISKRVSPANEKSFNGDVESAINWLDRTSSCLLDRSNLPAKFMNFAYDHAAFINNILYNRTSGKSPYQMIPPFKNINYKLIMPFGCLCVVFVPKEFRKRYCRAKHHNAEPGIFLGYKGQTIKIVYKFRTSKVHEEYHVRGHPNIFPKLAWDQENQIPLHSLQFPNEIDESSSNEIGTLLDDPPLEDDADGFQDKLLENSVTNDNILPDEVYGYNIRVIQKRTQWIQKHAIMKKI